MCLLFVMFCGYVLLLQMEGIQQKYDEVENEYVTSRVSAKKKMTEFIETNAGVKLSEFNDQLKKIRECVSQKHPVRKHLCQSKLKIKIWDYVDVFWTRTSFYLNNSGVLNIICRSYCDF